MRIAILGAESTGKSTLCHSLAARMRETGADVTVVGEYLREWCAEMMRTPLPQEQGGIALEQIRRIDTVRSPTVVADTTALMTAIYSDVLFQDDSLYPLAIEDIRRFQHVLVTATDLPWIADGFFRDSPQGQQAIHLRLQAVLRNHEIAYSMVYGNGEQRTQAAIAAIMPSQCSANADSETYNRWMARCEKCSDASCEHRLFRELTDG